MTLAIFFLYCFCCMRLYVNLFIFKVSKYTDTVTGLLEEIEENMKTPLYSRLLF